MAGTSLDFSLVGRQRQLLSLREWVGELAAGRGRVVLVEGEPGIGKSSLMRAAEAAAEKLKCQTYWASCDELSEAFPLRPLLDALDECSSTISGNKPSISEMLRADAVPGNRIDIVSAVMERLLAHIDELCTVAPTLLVVDDLQWADPATVMMLGRLARLVQQLPLLLLCTTRPIPRRKDLGALRRAVHLDGLIRLRGLSAHEVKEFVARAVEGRPGRRLLDLAAGAGGNPLYLTELLDALRRSQALSLSDGTVEVTGGRTPDSLAAAIADRLEFLSEPVQDVLRAAALLGITFSVADLSVVCGRQVTDLLSILDEAILAGVLRNDGHELSFRHPLIRAALYEGMAPAVRAAWHRDAARALSTDGAPPVRVARQLLPAVDAYDTARSVDEWIVNWLADACEQLVGQAPRAAIPLLRWAVHGIPTGVPPHDLLVCRLADAVYRSGDPAGAAEVALSALGHVSRPDLLVDLHWTLTQCRAMDGRSEESLRALQHALSAPGIGPQQQARLLVLTARAHRLLGRVDMAGKAANAALEAAAAVGDRWATGWALSVLTVVHGVRGETAEALPLFDRALAVADGDPALTDLRTLLQINKAIALGDLNRYDDAIVTAQHARQLADDAGNVVRLGQAQSALGELLFEVGRWDDALAEVDLVGGVTNDPVVECVDHGVAAMIQLHRGESSANRHLAVAERYANRLGDRIIASLALARSLERERDEAPDEALAVLLDELAEPIEETEEIVDLLADAARLAVDLNDRSTARNIVRRAELAARASNVPHRQAVALHCRGLLDQDPVQLLQAAELYKEAGRVLPQAQALEAAGVALAEEDDLTAARTRFSDAFALYSALRAGWDLARTQAKFRSYGIRRGPHAPHRRSRHGWDSLTPTELKVAGLVSRGMSNPDIAAELFLSRRTIQTHVSHILAKLDLHSRIDIAREASRRNISPRAVPGEPATRLP